MTREIRRSSTVQAAWRRAAGGGRDERVWECVAQLPEDFRVVLCLHYVEGYKVREVAAMTGVSAATVRTRLFRARERLRKLMRGA